MSAAPLVLNVFLNGARVGTITRLPDKGDLNIFVFNEAYLEDAQRPTLSLGFKGKTGNIAYEPKPYNTRVHPFFANLLPEGQLRDYIAARDNIHPSRDFHLLRALGDDLPGAVIIRAADQEAVGDDEADLSDTAWQDEEQPLKFSLAGVQLKFSAVRKAKGGLTIPAYGRGGAWIVKLPSEAFEAVPENEYAMMRVAARAGLVVPPIDLVPTSEIEGLPVGMRKGGSAFAIRRFDRDGEQGRKRIHAEDFAQVFRLWPTDKYKKASYGNIAQVIWTELGAPGLKDFVARLVFNIAIGNGDMHVKNWSLIYPDRRKPQMAPVYDYLSTLPYVAGTEALGLSLAGTKSFQAVSKERFVRFAEKGGFPVELVVTEAEEAAQRTVDAWSDLRRELGIPQYMIEMIEHHMARVPLIRDAYRPSVTARRSESE